MKSKKNRAFSHIGRFRLYSFQLHGNLKCTLCGYEVSWVRDLRCTTEYCDSQVLPISSIEFQFERHVSVVRTMLRICQCNTLDRELMSIDLTYVLSYPWFPLCSNLGILMLATLKIVLLKQPSLLLSTKTVYARYNLAFDWITVPCLNQSNAGSQNRYWDDSHMSRCGAVVSASDT